MGSIFNLLERVRERPAMYVGGDDDHRFEQMKVLETLLWGYSLALHEHGIAETAGQDFPRKFALYLGRRFGWEASCGPMVAIRDAVQSDSEAWKLLWTLIDDFRREER
jgi:hypothetical protein